MKQLLLSFAHFLLVLDFRKLKATGIIETLTSQKCSLLLDIELLLLFNRGDLFIDVCQKIFFSLRQFITIAHVHIHVNVNEVEVSMLETINLTR